MPSEIPTFSGYAAYFKLMVKGINKMPNPHTRIGLYNSEGKKSIWRSKSGINKMLNWIIPRLILYHINSTGFRFWFQKNIYGSGS